MKEKLFFIEDLVPQPRAAMVITHGLGEHCGRYASWVTQLNRADISVFRYDLPGHGQSRTRDWLFTDFEVLTAALRSMYRKAAGYSERHNIPLFLFGHSMGGLITADFVIRDSVPVTGVILSAPALDPGEIVRPWMIRAAGWLRRLLPGLPILKIPPEHLSRDKQVVTRYKNDQLVYQGRIKVETGYELLSRMSVVMRNAQDFHASLLMVQGEADQIVRPSVSRLFFDRVREPDKTWKSYPEMYHELLQDVGKEQVAEDILSWLNEKMRK